MNIPVITPLFGVVIGWMYEHLCFQNYMLTLVLFALFIKLILFPFVSSSEKHLKAGQAAPDGNGDPQEIRRTQRPCYSRKIKQRAYAALSAGKLQPGFGLSAASRSNADPVRPLQRYRQSAPLYFGAWKRCGKDSDRRVRHGYELRYQRHQSHHQHGRSGKTGCSFPD